MVSHFKIWVKNITLFKFIIHAHLNLIVKNQMYDIISPLINILILLCKKRSSFIHLFLFWIPETKFEITFLIFLYFMVIYADLCYAKSHNKFRFLLTMLFSKRFLKRILYSAWTRGSVHYVLWFTENINLI